MVFRHYGFVARQLQSLCETPAAIPGHHTTEIPKQLREINYRQHDNIPLLVEKISNPFDIS